MLAFSDTPSITRDIEKLEKKIGAKVINEDTGPIDQTKEEFAKYFAGSLREFKTPTRLFGTEFQKQA